jgi:hypothetical protein
MILLFILWRPIWSFPPRVEVFSASLPTAILTNQRQRSCRGPRGVDRCRSHTHASRFVHLILEPVRLSMRTLSRASSTCEAAHESWTFLSLCMVGGKLVLVEKIFFRGHLNKRGLTKIAGTVRKAPPNRSWDTSESSISPEPSSSLTRWAKSGQHLYQDSLSLTLV